jgi:uncharacterized protein involved in exopolysaccharide biosynthesis
MTTTLDQIDLLRSARIFDTVVRELALYVRPDNAADTSLLKNLRIGDRFMPGDYRIAVADSGSRWQLNIQDFMMADSGAVGDSIGWLMGLRWRPEPALLARYAGREVHFTVGTPRETATELQQRMTIMQPANSTFMQLTLTDPDPRRAARTLNAIASVYVASTRDLTGDKKSVLDSAVAPPSPFKNSAAQVFGVSLLIGIVAAIGLAFAASALEGRLA